MPKEYGIGKLYQGRLQKGDDLIEGLTKILKDKNITLGVVSGIGAVSEANIGFFNTETKEYEQLHLREDLEILMLQGNISHKNNDSYPHLHVVLSKRDFSALGGHLFSPTVVYAFEFVLTALEGEELVREYDPATALYLWKGK